MTFLKPELFVILSIISHLQMNKMSCCRITLLELKSAQTGTNETLWLSSVAPCLPPISESVSILAVLFVLLVGIELVAFR